MKYLIFFLIIIAGFGILSVQAQKSLEPGLETPKTLEEAKTLGIRILSGFPKALEKPLQEALAVWGKTLNWFKNLWYSYILPWLQNVWQKIDSFLGKEVEKRKPGIKEEFEKEKQEMKEDIPKVGKSLWQRFKELLK